MLSGLLDTVTVSLAVYKFSDVMVSMLMRCQVECVLLVGVGYAYFGCGWCGSWTWPLLIPKDIPQMSVSSIQSIIHPFIP